MSMRYKGAIISATAPTVSLSQASGAWTLQQQFQYQGAGTWPDPYTYIENVFSTYLYTGNGSTQTITNGIDLSTKGGLVWLKSRNNANSHSLFDTNRGALQKLESNNITASTNDANTLTAFTSSGFSLGTGASNAVNSSGSLVASWTFRKQPKFFDIVTYTGDGVQGRQIAHNLGSTPGCIMVKCTSTTSNWTVYHRSLTTNYILQLNSTTSAINVGSPNAYVSSPTNTTFTIGSDTDVNANGATYVAYLFAHDAGGFGATGSDNVISCGSYTGNGSTTGTVVTLGYEPQWVMIKRIDNTGGAWNITDNMRGFSVTNNNWLEANRAGTEYSQFNIMPSATGFQLTSINNEFNASGGTYIYIAIRRGPMKTPTTGTSVFYPSTATGVISSGTVVDSDWAFVRAGGVAYTPAIYDRLRYDKFLITSSIAAETAGADVGFDTNNGLKYSWDAGRLNYFFSRAPSFFDVVCYTGNDANRTLNHNLGVAPELMIVKRRDGATNWPVYSLPTTATKVGYLNTTDAFFTDSLYWNNTSPTSTVFTIGAGSEVNNSGSTYVAYLFASCPGVSKVGSYTGTGGTFTVDCGFTGGARYVLIKRTDSTGNWYVWDTARGMVAGTDPKLALNSTAAETNANWVYTTSVGFQVVGTDASINASGGSYIYLAIA